MNKLFSRAVILVLTALLIMPLALQAKKVKQEDAHAYAQRFTRLKHSSKTNARLKHTAVKQKSAAGMNKATQLGQTAATEDTLYYTYNIDGGGFVIIAASDVVMPVLGYSAAGNYNEENLPPNFAYWIDYLSRQIAWAKEEGITQSTAVQEAWAATSFIPTQIVGDTLKTKWGQGAPYNKFIPTNTWNPSVGYDGKNAAGCVAAAMAQIMKKHKHPQQGVGKRNGTDFNINYDWDNMLDDYSIVSAGDAEIDATATLIYHAGISVDMAWGPLSTANMYNSIGAFRTYWGYDKNIESFYRENFKTGSDWNAVLRDQIDNGMPVLYYGEESGMNNGHAFVCDAYDKNSDYFHFNWGWGGIYNGWFLTTALNPQGDAGVYTDRQIIIGNIKPASEEGEHDERYDLLASFSLGTGSSSTGPSIGIGIGGNVQLDTAGYETIEVQRLEAFVVSKIRTINISYSNPFAQRRGNNLGIGLVNDNEEVISILADMGISTFYPALPAAVSNHPNHLDLWQQSNYPTVTCRVPNNIAPGKYKLRFIFLPEGVNSWEAALNDWNAALGTPDYLVRRHPFGKGPAYANVIVLEPNDITPKFTDTAFRAAVLELTGKSAGGRIYLEDVETITKLNVQNKSIMSLNGIEYFTSLRELDCSGNRLSSLNLSKNSKLVSLNCSYNVLTTINVSGTQIENLDCRNNKLKAIDVSGLPVKVLICNNNFMPTNPAYSGVIGFPDNVLVYENGKSVYEDGMMVYEGGVLTYYDGTIVRDEDDMMVWKTEEVFYERGVLVFYYDQISYLSHINESFDVNRRLQLASVYVINEKTGGELHVRHRPVGVPIWSFSSNFEFKDYEVSPQGNFFTVWMLPHITAAMAIDRNAEAISPWVDMGDNPKISFKWWGYINSQIASPLNDLLEIRVYIATDSLNWGEPVHRIPANSANLTGYPSVNSVNIDVDKKYTNMICKIKIEFVVNTPNTVYSVHLDDVAIGSDPAIININNVGEGVARAASPDGTVIEEGEPLFSGQSVIVTAQPAYGHRVKEWKVNGEVVYAAPANTLFPSVETQNSEIGFPILSASASPIWPNNTKTSNIDAFVSGNTLVFPSLKGAANVTVEYEPHIFQVAFVDWEYLLIGDIQTVPYGENAIVPIPPEREGYRFTGWNADFSNITQDLIIAAQYGATTSIRNPEREHVVIPERDVTFNIEPDAHRGFTAGPNPVAKSDRIINFFWQGKHINNTKLTIYNASGNAVRKINIRDNGAGALFATPFGETLTSRIVGSWDLRDSKARPVSEGTYLVKGVIKRSDGRRERVSLILGIR